MLAGALLAAVSPAVAHAQAPQSGDPGILQETDRIQNLKSGKVLQAVSSANGAKVVQQTRNVDNDLQSWFLILNNTYFSYQNFQSDLNLGIDGASMAAGAAAITAKPSSDANQDWIIKWRSSTVFEMKNRNSGKCLGISGASEDNGAQAAQFDCDGKRNQGWILN